MERPLILFTNDDGIHSRGLWAAVEALLDLGDVLVVAPDRQWSGAGRAMLGEVTGAVTEAGREVTGRWVEAYAVDATPALTVVHGLLEFAPRRPALVVAGINSGENVSVEVTASGTVGAALEGAAAGIPALAVSLAMPLSHHHRGDVTIDYRASLHFTRYFARLLLERSLPFDADLLNVNVPERATPRTPWRLTRLSRHRYFLPLVPKREKGQGRPGYRIMTAAEETEPGSDVYALVVEGVVSVTPLSLDLTSRADFGEVEERLRSPS